LELVVQTVVKVTDEIQMKAVIWTDKS